LTIGTGRPAELASHKQAQSVEAADLLGVFTLNFRRRFNGWPSRIIVSGWLTIGIPRCISRK